MTVINFKFKKESYKLKNKGEKMNNEIDQAQATYYEKFHIMEQIIKHHVKDKVPEDAQNQLDMAIFDLKVYSTYIFDVCNKTLQQNDLKLITAKDQKNHKDLQIQFMRNLYDELSNHSTPDYPKFTPERQMIKKGNVTAPPRKKQKLYDLEEL